MDESNQPLPRFPLADCEFCNGRTPHVHERLAVDGKQVARSRCLSCNRERPRELPRGLVRRVI